MLRNVLLAPLLLGHMAAASGDDEHGEHAFEWAGSFHTPITSGTARNYAWTMQIVDTEWADPTMDLVVMKIDGDTDEDLEAKEEIAEVPLLACHPVRLSHSSDCGPACPAGTLGSRRWLHPDKKPDGRNGTERNAVLQTHS